MYRLLFILSTMHTIETMHVLIQLHEGGNVLLIIFTYSKDFTVMELLQRGTTNTRICLNGDWTDLSLYCRFQY